MKHDIFSFSILWNGQLRPTESGEYTISILHDDYVRFTCSGQTLIDAHHGDLAQTSGIKISLKRGESYPIELEYRHDGGDLARIRFGCEKIGELTGSAVSASEMTGRYYAGAELNVLMAERTDAQINFIWNTGSPPHPVFHQQLLIPLIWPQGVRHYSYRRDPELPAGNAPMHDNVQIAFNVLEEGDKELLEMALPWDEIPDVHQRLLAGKTIQFSYRVNDNGSSGIMELARGRSVSKLNPSFYVDWREHWANELEFYFEKSELSD
jgi:hypothetical protein